MHRQVTDYVPYCDQVFDDLARTLSSARLEVYLRAAGFNKARALRLYVWNAELSEAFQFPIHMTEVVIRNSVSAVLAAKFGPRWPESREVIGVLGGWAVAEMNKTANRLERRYGDFTEDHFIAALSFGFWIHVLKPEFHRLIWREHLRRAFPNLPREISGKDLHQKLDDIGSLRNRIAHHEPLLRADHSRLHSDIVGVIGFVCAQTAAWARAHSKVPTILRSRP